MEGDNIKGNIFQYTKKTLFFEKSFLFTLLIKQFFIILTNAINLLKTFIF